ncbi:MAG: hypothetical protein WD825_14215 [Gemmatimonadaceae bacterium]
MTYIGGVRLRMAIFVGALAGVGAGLVFATAHAFIIVPIWDRMTGGLVFAAIAGAVGGWSFTELYAERIDAGLGRAAIAGGLYGALLWIAVSPVSAIDFALRKAGVLPRYELLGVAVALLLAAATGSFLGWYRRRSRRGMIAGAAATILLTVAMAGPVPIGRSSRAFGIFLSVLPASIVAGVILGMALHLTVRFRAPFPNSAHDAA